MPAAFGRLCVETGIRYNTSTGATQPPSGGCVLKQFRTVAEVIEHGPAAFGRLCVETFIEQAKQSREKPAAFGRLCVETWTNRFGWRARHQPPSGGCVLKRPPFGRVYREI